MGPNNSTSYSAIVLLCFSLLFILGCDKKESESNEPKSLPLVKTNHVNEITNSSARVYGEILDPGNPSFSEKGFCWNTTGSPNIAHDPKITSNVISVGIFSSGITGLNPNTTIFFRAYATNTQGTDYGDELVFTTNTNFPLVSCDSISMKAETSAMFYGNLKSGGTTPIIEKGFCWNNSGTPGLENNIGAISFDNDLGEFSFHCIGLDPNSTYYVIAYTKLNSGNIYSEVKAFNTLSITPSKKVLIEVFTGHLSFNSPEAFGYLGEFQDNFPDRIIDVAIHYGFFAGPILGGLYTTDYRSTSGNLIGDFFEAEIVPSASINRVENDNNNYLYLAPNWENVISQEMSQSSEAEIFFNIDYHPETSEVYSTADVVFLNQLTGNYFIVLYIVEDKLISAQKNNNESVGPVPDWTFYEHNSVLRAAMNNTWGSPITDNLIVNETYSYMFGLINMEEEWNNENCKLLFYIYHQESNRIIQVTESEYLPEYAIIE